jgi:hypothetical protein
MVSATLVRRLRSIYIGKVFAIIIEKSVPVTDTIRALLILATAGTTH